MALLESGHEREGLERRARLAGPVGDDVVLGLFEAWPADEGADRSVRRVHRHEGSGEATVGVGQVVVDLLQRNLLEVGIERGVDAQAAVEDLLVSVLSGATKRRVRAQEDLLDLVDEVVEALGGLVDGLGREGL